MCEPPSRDQLQRKFDKVGRGSEKLNLEQFKDLLSLYYVSLSKTAFNNIVEALDKNEDNMLSFEEVEEMFKIHWQPKDVSEKEFLQCLDMCCENQYPITRTKLRHILQEMGDDPLTEQDVQDIFGRLDLNNDKEITREEIQQRIFEEAFSRATTPMIKSREPVVNMSPEPPVENGDAGQDDDAQETQPEQNGEAQAEETQEKSDDAKQDEVQETNDDAQEEGKDATQDEPTGENVEEQEAKDTDAAQDDVQAENTDAQQTDNADVQADTTDAQQTDNADVQADTTDAQQTDNADVQADNADVQQVDNADADTPQQAESTDDAQQEQGSGDAPQQVDNADETKAQEAEGTTDKPTDNSDDKTSDDKVDDSQQAV